MDNSYKLTFGGACFIFLWALAHYVLITGQYQIASLMWSILVIAPIIQMILFLQACMLKRSIFNTIGLIASVLILIYSFMAIMPFSSLQKNLCDASPGCVNL